MQYNPLLKICWEIYFLLSLLTVSYSTTFALGASPSRSTSAKLHTAADAAMAMNSLEFIKLLSSFKNTDDIKTYTLQSPTASPSSSAKQRRFASRVSGRGCSRTNRSPSDPASRESVSEYTGRLWFLPRAKGIRFRETIRILSMSADGRSSTLECTTQYRSGARWVDCSNIIVSIENDGAPTQESGEELQVKMTLECEILVSFLPATKHVRKKICNVFQEVAVDFFNRIV